MAFHELRRDAPAGRRSSRITKQEPKSFEGGDDAVTGPDQRQERVEHRGHAARRGEAGLGALHQARRSSKPSTVGLLNREYM